jgi:hypothetical protein
MAPQHKSYRIDTLMLLVVALLASAVPYPVAGQAPVPSVDILQARGCDVGAVLAPNMQDCVLSEGMSSNGTMTFTFAVGARPSHSLLVTLRTVGGGAIM